MSIADTDLERQGLRRLWVDAMHDQISQVAFDVGPHVLGRVEIWGVGRKLDSVSCSILAMRSFCAGILGRTCSLPFHLTVALRSSKSEQTSAGEVPKLPQRWTMSCGRRADAKSTSTSTARPGKGGGQDLRAIEVPARPPEDGKPDGWCARCDAPQGLALVRADTPPNDWKDLLHRMLMLVASGHWSARKTVQLVALGGAVVVLLYMVVRNPDVLRFIGGSPWGWPVVAGGAVTAGGWVWWRRRKRAIPEARGLPEMASKHGPQLIGNDRDTAQEATDERPGVGR
jgi:hypothetical protein